MHEERPFKDKVTVRFVKRDDGGLRALCEAVPGFLPISRPLGSASVRFLGALLVLKLLKTRFMACKDLL